MTPKQENIYVTSVVVIAVLMLVTVIFVPIYNRVTDPFGGVEPDMGRSLHETGRPAEWVPTSMPLGNTGFTASAGPYMYADEDNKEWDFYSIDVERPIGNSSYVFFERELNIKDIPTEIINKRVEDIVKFDENSGVVTFELGDKSYTYKLPDI